MTDKRVVEIEVPEDFKNLTDSEITVLLNNTARKLAFERERNVKRMNKTSRFYLEIRNKDGFVINRHYVNGNMRNKILGLIPRFPRWVKDHELEDMKTGELKERFIGGENETN